MRPLTSDQESTVSFSQCLLTLGFAVLLVGCGEPDPVPITHVDTAPPAEAPAVSELETEVRPDGQIVLGLLDEGSAERGEETFYAYGCWQCHTVGDDEAPGMRDGLTMGPDLATVGDRLSPEEILQSIQDPNAVIAEPRDDHVIDGFSTMPSFNDPAALSDIKDIVSFLAHCQEPDSVVGSMTAIADAEFDAVIAGESELVLLDFWAEWCFACLETNPALEAMAPDYAGKVRFFKVEVDENPDLVARFVPDVMFPCFVLMKDGEVLDRKYGVPATMEPTPFFESWIAEHLDPR